MNSTRLAERGKENQLVVLPVEWMFLKNTVGVVPER